MTLLSYKTNKVVYKSNNFRYFLFFLHRGRVTFTRFQFWIIFLFILRFYNKNINMLYLCVMKLTLLIKLLKKYKLISLIYCKFV